MSIGGAGNNRPVNTGATLPTAGAGQAKEPGMEFVQDLVLGGKVHTAQAQPPGKSFTETMGAAFTAMGADVTNFFKGLGDRMASIEMPQLPRISLRRQEEAQQTAAPERAQMKPQLAGQLVQLENAVKACRTPAQKLEKLLAPPGNSMLGKAIAAHAAKNLDAPNLNFMRGLSTGISLGELREKYIFKPLAEIGQFSEVAVGSAAGNDAALNLDGPKLNALMKALDAAMASGLGDAEVMATFDPDTQNFKVGVQGARAEELSIESTSLLADLQKQITGAHQHVMREMVGNSFGSNNANGLFHVKNSTMQEARNLASEGASAMQKSNDNEQAEIGKLKAMSASELGEALKADPSLGRHLTADFMNSRVAGREMAGARFVPQNESSVDPQTFGGAMSTLSKITYRDGTVGMFKGDEGKGVITHNPSINAGIPADIAAANLSARAVATSRLDGALGLNLVPPTEFAVHDGRSGTVQEFAKGQTLMAETRTRIPVSDLTGVTMFLNGQPLPEAQEPAEFDFNDYLGLVDRAAANEDLGFGSTLGGPEFSALKEALGKAVAGLNNGGTQPDPSLAQQVKALAEAGTIFFTKLQRTSNELVLDSPSVQRSMSNAHVMDLLCGQLDRNPGNFIFVNSGDGGLQVKLIDNDLSFGDKFTSLSESSMNKIGSAMLPTSLPRLIDAGTAARVLAMTPDALRAELADTGLGDDEMHAAASRLGQLQGHIRQIQAGDVPGGQLVSDWNAQTYQSLMQAPDNYVQRSMENIAAATGAAPGA